MNNYEQAKLANGSLYDLVPGGITEAGEKLTIITLLGDRSLLDIDSETDNPINTARIEVLDSAGDLIDIKKGYLYQTSCRKQKDYVIGRQEIDSGQMDEDGNPIMEYQDIIGTVVVIELVKSDLRKEVQNLSETVDMLVLSNLEG